VHAIVNEMLKRLAAEQVSDDRTGWCLSIGDARPDREEQQGDRGYGNSLSVHVLILLGFHLVMPGDCPLR
jgi:hypothetical protein